MHQIRRSTSTPNTFSLSAEVRAVGFAALIVWLGQRTEGGASVEGRQIPATETNTLGQQQNLRRHIC